MSGKKKPAGKQIALCLLLTAAVDGLGVLLVTLLAVKGIVGEDRVPQALGALAFCAAARLNRELLLTPSRVFTGRASSCCWRPKNRPACRLSPRS